jgi:hypothetical protein
VIFSGVVSKKMYFGNYKDRTMALHSFPKLVYYDTDSGEKKGEIFLSKKTPVKHDGKYFEVTTDKKTYYFKSKQAKEWTEMIKFSVLNAFY